MTFVRALETLASRATQRIATGWDEAAARAVAGMQDGSTASAGRQWT